MGQVSNLRAAFQAALPKFYLPPAAPVAPAGADAVASANVAQLVPAAEIH